jgi:hypothetical protein
VALLGNRTVLHKSAAIFRNGTSTAGAYVAGTINNFTKSGPNRNIFANNIINKANAVPMGYTHPYNFVMPQKNGGMASFKYLSALASSTADLAGGKNAESSISATMTLSDANMGLIVSAIANLSASVSVTNAELAAVLDMVANLISASGTLTPPTLGAIAGVLADLVASGTISSASMNDSIGYMTSEITPYTELSPESLAAAVLNAILANYNDPGSVGEALNNVGASGNPWASSLSTNTDPGTFGEHMQKLLTLAKYMGLK